MQKGLQKTGHAEFISASRCLEKEEILNQVQDDKKGFALIELLVVVLIIGILAAVALPQYKKAVTKSRFAEAFTNLKSIAQAHQVCFMEKGEGCNFGELSIELGKRGNDIWGVDKTQETKQFMYHLLTNDTTGNPVWAVAQYKDEDVCLCYRQTGEIVLSQDEASGCYGGMPSFNYASLLNVRDVGFDGCACC